MAADPSHIYRHLGIEIPHIHPSDWMPWREPEPALPIDEMVSALLKRKRDPRVPKQIRQKRNFCPYYAARSYTVSAICEAHREDEACRLLPARILQLKRICKSAERALASLKSLADNLNDHDAYKLGDRFLERSIADRRDFQMALDARDSTLAQLPMLVDQMTILQNTTVRAVEAATSSRSKVDHWNVGFAFAIGELWVCLFDEMPSTHNQSLFVELIEAAHNSVCSTENAWDRAKSSAIKRHKDSLPESGFERHALAERANARLTEDEIRDAQAASAARLKAMPSAMEAAKRDIEAEMHMKKKH